jgi:hypothetical protein
MKRKKILAMTIVELEKPSTNSYSQGLSIFIKVNNHFCCQIERGTGRIENYANYRLILGKDGTDAYKDVLAT